MGNIFVKEQATDNRERHWKCKGSVHCPKVLWTLVHKRLKQEGYFSIHFRRDRNLKVNIYGTKHDIDYRKTALKTTEGPLGPICLPWPSTCSNTLGDTTSPQWLVICNFPEVVPRHCDVVRRVTSGLPWSSWYSFTLLWVHISACFGILFSPTLSTCPSHCSLVFLIMSSSVSIYIYAYSVSDLFISDFIFPFDTQHLGLPCAIFGFKSLRICNAYAPSFSAIL